MWQKLQTLPNQQTHRGKILYWHIRDGAVWHQHRKIRRADPATLEVFQTDGGSGFIARDKNHVYHAWTTLKNIGRASFEHIAAYLWRDKNHVYAEHETSLRAIAEADPATFRYLGNDWAADRHHAYYATRRVKHCTRLDTLRLIGACYAADADHVYWDGKLLPQADPASWRHLHDSFSKKLRHVYYGTRIIPRENPADWNTERAQTTDVMRVMRHIAQAQADDTAA